MQQELAFDLTLFEIVHELLVFFGAERRRNHCLRLAASKQSRTVRSRQPANFARDWSESQRIDGHQATTAFRISSRKIFSFK